MNPVPVPVQYYWYVSTDTVPEYKVQYSCTVQYYIVQGEVRYSYRYSTGTVRYRYENARTVLLVY